MELEEAIKILKQHNKWRRYNGVIDSIPKMIDPRELGIAIDTVVNEFEEITDGYADITEDVFLDACISTGRCVEMFDEFLFTDEITFQIEDILHRYNDKTARTKIKKLIK